MRSSAEIVFRSYAKFSSDNLRSYMDAFMDFTYDPVNVRLTAVPTHSRQRAHFYTHSTHPLSHMYACTHTTQTHVLFVYRSTSLTGPPPSSRPLR